MIRFILWGALIILIISALAGVVRNQRTKEDEAFRSETAQIVKNLMNHGVYYSSTESEKPLYDGEAPTYSFKNEKSINELIKDCKSLKETPWARDLERKKDEYRQTHNN